VAQLDQIAWTLSENYIVFQDRYWTSNLDFFRLIADMTQSSAA
jgi:hypothetical protein